MWRFAKRDLNLHVFSISRNADVDLISGFVCEQRVEIGMSCIQSHIADLRDDVALLDSGRFRRAACSNSGHIGAPLNG